MSKDEIAVPTGLALTHLDPVFRERPGEYLDMLRSRELVNQDRMFDRVVLTRAADVEAVMNNRSLAFRSAEIPPGFILSGATDSGSDISAAHTAHGRPGP
jgi:hypothetical protein